LASGATQNLKASNFAVQILVSLPAALLTQVATKVTPR